MRCHLRVVRVVDLEPAGEGWRRGVQGRRGRPWRHALGGCHISLRHAQQVAEGHGFAPS
jgi:hypothetical protein